MDVNEISMPDIDPGKAISLGTLLVFCVVAILLAYNGFYTVRENEQAVVMRFGKIHGEPALSGMHFCIPLVDTIVKVNVTEERRIRLPFGGGAERPTRSSEADTLMLTADLNAASVEWTIQWRITDSIQKVKSFYHPLDPTGDLYLSQVITLASRTVMNRLVGDYSIDEVLTGKRSEIRQAAKEQTQSMLDEYRCGVVITDLQMQRVRPPRKVRPAFDAVNKSIQERDKLENEANKQRNQLIPQARADKDKKVREAEGYASRRRAEVGGEIKALRARYEAYKMAPEVTRQRLYLEAMEEILSGVESKTIVDSDLQKSVPLLPLLPLNEGSAP